YVPMASPSPSLPSAEGDSYIPMTESASSLSPVMCQPGEIAPPPVHRHLKPRLRKGEKNFRSECEKKKKKKTNLGLIFIMASIVWELFSISQKYSYTLNMLSSSSNLDYLSLDFNSASPSPVQKKPLLADGYKVDYVQVDEKKTQALQNTKMEWKDVRHLRFIQFCQNKKRL
uniref:Uncharacterized protein n=1 Tax=Xiphophorus couchianus TaxID=32473 RepID=A0A3B5LB51_9TELE